MEIILASASPRRREICQLLGIDVQIRPADDEPAFDPALTVEENALAVARAKARTVKNAIDTDLPVLGSDTSVILDDEHGAVALGKPQNEEDAKAMLRRLQGRSHRVLTSVWVCGKDSEDGYVDQTAVRFAPMSERDIDEYIACGESMDKAGAYAIQGRGSRYIDGIDGDYYTVMGLPAASLWRFLQQFS